MTTTQLLALDLAAAILAVGSWVGAAVLASGAKSSRRKTLGALGLIALGTLALIGDGLVVAVLSSAGWWFVQEKVVLALPLAALGTAAALVFAVPALARRVRGRATPHSSMVVTSLVGAAIAGAAGIAARYVVSYPLSFVAAATLVILSALGTWLCFAVLAGKGKRLVAGISLLTCLGLVASVGFAWLSSVATPGALASAHEHAPQPEGVQAVSVTDLRTPVDGGVLKHFEFIATEKTLTLASGASANAWTFGSVPGPEVRVEQGDIVDVDLYNADVAAGVTLHWHGVDLPNGDDGVAGVTQNAVLPGETFTYRFVAEDVGTYWYHTHQSSSDGVKRGLFGSFIVEPVGGVDEDVDVVVPVHTLGGSVLLGTSDEQTTVEVDPGDSVRLRLLNTDQVPHRFLIAGAPFEVAAVDGRDVRGPTPVEDAALRIPAGGRVDVVLTVGQTGVLVRTDASQRAEFLISTGVTPTATIDEQAENLDLLSYGEPTTPELPTGEGFIDAEMVLDLVPRFMDGVPLQGYTVNGQVFPHIDNITVSEGDVLRLTVANRSFETHPMHIHGHHVLVLSRNGIPASGSPLWLDTFDVQPGEVWVVALVADNPGIWMDHCHNLDHAAEGMMMALRYEGVTSPFEEGGAHGNKSE